MKRYPRPLKMPVFAGALLAFSMITASGAVIDGTVNSLTTYSVSNLEETNGAASDHWVIYGPMGAASGNGSQFTSKTEISPFSTVVRDGGEWRASLNGRIKFSHGAGFGDYPDATASSDAYGSTADSATFASVSFSYTMQGTAEDFSIYFLTKDNASIPVDLSASLSSSGGAYNVSDVVPPTASGNYGLGRLDLSITGATIGETLNFTISTDYSDFSGTPENYYGVGLAGVSSTVVVPEPSTFAFLTVLGAGFLVARRVRSKRSGQ